MLLNEVIHGGMGAVGQMNMGLAEASIILIRRVFQKRCFAHMFNVCKRDGWIIELYIHLGKLLGDLIQNLFVITKRHLTRAFDPRRHLWRLGYVGDRNGR